MDLAENPQPSAHRHTPPSKAPQRHARKPASSLTVVEKEHAFIIPYESGFLLLSHSESPTSLKMSRSHPNAKRLRVRPPEAVLAVTQSPHPPSFPRHADLTGSDTCESVRHCHRYRFRTFQHCH